jgi:hypothetical protein
MATKRQEQYRSEVLESARMTVFNEITTPREIDVARKIVILLGRRAVIEALDGDPAFKGGTRQATRLQELVDGMYGQNVFGLGQAAADEDDCLTPEQQAEIDRGVDLAMQIADSALRLEVEDAQIEKIVADEWQRKLEADKAKSQG